MLCNRLGSHVYMKEILNFTIDFSYIIYYFVAIEFSYGKS